MPTYLKDISLLNIPTFSISTSTTSPFWRNLFGFMKAPTPAAVPVITAVPAGIVVPEWVVSKHDQNGHYTNLPWLIWLSTLDGEKIMSFVISAVWRTSPLTLVITRYPTPLANNSGLISVGPIGANLSNALAKKNWPPEFCGSWNLRQLISFPIV